MFRSPRSVSSFMANRTRLVSGGSQSTMTNDPVMKRCRVFIGNLNTLKITKQQVQETFSQYGNVCGVSVHKGYGFVQYMNEIEARIAAESEDGRSYAGQVIDCNIASEPKAKVHSRKRATTGTIGWQSGGPQNKQAKLTSQSIGGHRNLVSVSTDSVEQSSAEEACYDLDNVHAYEARDVLFCGNCKEGFTSIHQFVDHKKSPCKLATTCECHPADAPETFLCYHCGEEFRTCWSLVKHCQTTHGMPIYVQNQEAIKNNEEDNGDVKERQDEPAE